MKNGSLERLLEDADAILEGGDLSDVTSRHLLIAIVRQSFMKTKLQIEHLKEDLDTKIDDVCKLSEDGINQLRKEQEESRKLNEKIIENLNSVQGRLENLEEDSVDNPSIIKVFKESPIKVIQAVLYLMGAGSFFWISDLRTAILDSLGLNWDIGIFVPLIFFGAGLLIEAYKKAQRIS